MVGPVLGSRCSSARSILTVVMLLVGRNTILSYVPRRHLSWSTTISDARSRLFASLTETPKDAATEDPTLTPKEKRRRRFIERRGLPKAVDRGQFAVTYAPGGEDRKSFQALSGLPENQALFTVLGIESSCDDTGAAVVRSDGVILGEALASQSEIHEPWGGIVPGLAMEAHKAVIDQIVKEALTSAGMSSPSEVDAIGVTVGPGLEICLRVGATKAREMALEHNKPFVGVHHLEAHILMARLPFDDDRRNLEFPFLALLVSGGHCQLLKCKGVGDVSVLGGTFDDSLGEAFDKTARLLGLPVGGGGGPAVEKLALEGDPKAIPMSVPLQARKDCDFSYSGLKSNVRRLAEKLVLERGVNSTEELPHEDKANIAASFQNVAIRHLEQRLKYAMTLLEQEEDCNIKSLALVGGVAANKEIRKRINAICEEREDPWQLFVPPPRLCTDQGTMSAWAAVERIKLGSSDDPTPQEVYARFPFSTKSLSDNTEDGNS